MARCSPPGDRDAIEAALSPAELAGLRSVCATLGVPVDRWQSIVALQQVFETTAVMRLAEQITIEDGRNRKAAIFEAALRLGVHPDTARTRLERWPRLAYGPGVIMTADRRSA